MSGRLDLALGVLNGAIGDHLARTDNGLAIAMGCYAGGREVPLDRASVAAAYPAATGRVVVLVHGLMCTEAVWRMPDGEDYGSLLARDLGVSPVYVRYNTGRAIADSGAALASLLDELVTAWPVRVEEIIPVGYSMGGLVVRAATHAAALGEARFLPLVKRAIYVGTPHRGAPLERAARAAARLLRGIEDPYTRLFADLAALRSEGVRDLGDADLRHEDRARLHEAMSLRDARHPVPLLPSIQHHLVAGALWEHPLLASLFGDAMVPVPSGTDGGCVDVETMALPPEHVALLPGLDHVALAHHPRVYERIRAWCSP